MTARLPTCNTLPLLVFRAQLQRALAPLSRACHVEIVEFPSVLCLGKGFLHQSNLSLQMFQLPSCPHPQGHVFAEHTSRSGVASRWALWSAALLTPEPTLPFNAVKTTGKFRVLIPLWLVPTGYFHEIYLPTLLKTVTPLALLPGLNFPSPLLLPGSIFSMAPSDTIYVLRIYYCFIFLKT